MAAWSAERRLAGATIGFVPTMGALHRGHLALVARSKQECDHTVVSIFVNERQFNRAEDYGTYPRPVDDDLRACAEAQVDAVYLPESGEMYPPGFETTISPGATAEPFEGASRPGHFGGVATVVAKLLHAVDPHRAYLGRKDYQQWRVIEAMVRDLDFGTTIIGLPTVREPDGLALSSRNALLSPQDRIAAAVIPRALRAAEAAWAAGERRPAALRDIATSVLASEPAARIDYLEIADPLTLGAPSGQSLVVLVAAWFGQVRLIDNVELGP